ncbi:MAG: acyltransferase [Clostridia bacterium]|nr:acyltransferase [Clostridia bacterium]
MAKPNERASRNSSIELLRIVSIFMVVLVHYFGCIKDYAAGTANEQTVTLLSCCVIIGVNCFVLISGYFGIFSKGLKIRRLLDLLLVIAFFGGLDYASTILFGTASFSIKDLFWALFPYLNGGVWFVRVYLALAVIAPFLSIGLRALTKSQYRVMLILSLIFFSVWQSFFPHPLIEDGGYGIVHFVLLYAIGGYLQLHARKDRPWWIYGLIYVACVGLTVFCPLIGWPNTYFCYDFILNIVSACALLFMFSKWQFQSKLVNTLAATTFGTYIIHEGMSWHAILYTDIFQVQAVAASSWLPLIACGTCLLQLIACMIVLLLQRLLFRFTVDKALDAIPFLNKTLFTAAK